MKHITKKTRCRVLAALLAALLALPTALSLPQNAAVSAAGTKKVWVLASLKAGGYSVTYKYGSDGLINEMSSGYQRIMDKNGVPNFLAPGGWAYAYSDLMESANYDGQFIWKHVIFRDKKGRTSRLVAANGVKGGHFNYIFNGQCTVTKYTDLQWGFDGKGRVKSFDQETVSGYDTIWTNENGIVTGISPSIPATGKFGSERKGDNLHMHAKYTYKGGGGPIAVREEQPNKDAGYTNWTEWTDIRYDGEFAESWDSVNQYTDPGESDSYKVSFKKDGNGNPTSVKVAKRFNSEYGNGKYDPDYAVKATWKQIAVPAGNADKARRQAVALVNCYIIDGAGNRGDMYNRMAWLMDWRHDL